MARGHFASFALMLAACGSAPQPHPALATSGEMPVAVSAEAVAAVRGTLLVRFDLTGANPRQTRAIEAWFGETLGQSPFLDVELGESPAGAGEIVVRGELTADGSGTLTTTLIPRDGAPLPLAHVQCPSAASLPEALDTLAARTRALLGEPSTSLASDRRPARSLVSGTESVADACARAVQLAEQRALAEASRSLETALRTDPACGLALSLLAGVRMDQGDAKGAVDRAGACLRLDERLSPASRHRAGRTLLVASRNHEGLLQLADEMSVARPRDWQPRFTRALGLCLLARYAEALPLLEALHGRLPASPGVVFCLGHARLATGNASGAQALLAEIRQRVPPLPAGRFEALVLFALGEQDALRTHLEALQRQATALRGRAGEIELLGQRAAQALLAGDDTAAASLLLEQLDHLRGAPSLLQQSSDLLVGSAWVLSRLGRAADCRRLLAALRGQDGLPPPARAPGVAAEMICQQASGVNLTDAQLTHLDTLGLRGWRYRLEARAVLAAGNAERARLLLKTATEHTNDPTLVLDLAECARMLGRPEEGDRLLVEAARELSVPRLDAPERHPLSSARLALLWREAQRVTPARVR